MWSVIERTVGDDSALREARKDIEVLLDKLPDSVLRLLMVGGDLSSDTIKKISNELQRRETAKKIEEVLERKDEQSK